MRKTILTMWICPRCGSDNVQFKEWRNANTGVTDSFNPFEDEDCWCDDCETHKALITKDIPVKNKVIGFQVKNDQDQICLLDKTSVYSLDQAREMIYQQPDLILHAIRKGDIEEPRMMFTGDPRQ